MEIFGEDTAKIDQLNEILCKKAGFPSCYDISYQTYPRKVDLNVANAVCGLGGMSSSPHPFFFHIPSGGGSVSETNVRRAATVQQITGDIRHLANMKEMEEPFDKDQIGSSAMAYKRNPMRSERIGSLGRKLASLPVNFSNTMAMQWMERTLDDSAIRRIDIPEMFLLADAYVIPPSPCAYLFRGGWYGWLFSGNSRTQPPQDRDNLGFMSWEIDPPD